jgi:hypothetical protein
LRTGMLGSPSMRNRVAFSALALCAMVGALWVQWWWAGELYVARPRAASATVPAPSARSPTSDIYWPANLSPKDAFVECLLFAPLDDEEQRVSSCVDTWQRKFPGVPFPEHLELPKVRTLLPQDGRYR